MVIHVYKDTLANNRGADVAVRNLAAGLSERGHAVVLFEKPELDVRLREVPSVIVAAGTNELLDLAAAQVTIPVVLQFHTDPRYAFRHWIKKWRRNRAIKAAMRKCAAIQVLREEHVTYVRRIAPNVPVHVIGNWSSYSELKPIETKASEDIIVYPAAVNKDKNQRLLLAAFSTLTNEFPNWRLELYGKGTKNGHCDLREVYANCAFVAFPSKTEGFGLVIADAAVFGKPCVMIKDWIGTCAAGGGIVTEPTVKAYAAGLRKLMADEDLRRQMGARAKSYCAEHYSREKILDQWEALLKEVARK